MRTAIYIHEPSTVTIHAADPSDAKIQLYRFNHGAARPALGTHRLEPGIYLVVSSGEIEVSSRNIGTQIVANDKDPWPDPSAAVVGLESGASAASVKDFFTLAKDIDIDD